MSKAFKFIDKSKKCDLILKAISGDLEKIQYRNSTIIFSGNEEFIATPLFDSDSYLLHYSMYTTKIINPINILKWKNIKFTLYPTLSGLSIKEIYNNFNKLEIPEILDSFFIVISINNKPKYYFKDEKIKISDWLSFSIAFEKERIQLFINDFLTKYIFDYNTDKMCKMDIELEIDKSSFTFLSNQIRIS